jgi:hypothetical protein
LSPNLSFFSILQHILHSIVVGECMIECLNIGRNYTFYKSIRDFFKLFNGHGFYFLEYYYYII